MRFLLSRVVPLVAGLAVAVKLALDGKGLSAAFLSLDAFWLAAAAGLQLAGAACLGPRWRAVLIWRGLPAPTPWASAVLTLRAQSALPLLPGGLGADVVRYAEWGQSASLAGNMAQAALSERIAGGFVLALVSAGLVCAVVLGPAVGALSVVAGALVPMLLWRVAPSGGKIAGTISVLRSRTVLAWTLGNQACAISAFALALHAAGIHAGALQLLMLASVSAFVTMLPISINGYGVRELALAGLSSTIAVPMSQLVGASLVSTTALLAILVGFALLSRLVPSGIGAGNQIDAKQHLRA